MRKTAFLLAFISLFGFQTRARGQGTDPATDLEILPGSWIYEAFAQLAAHNLLPGFEGSDFRGNRVLTREAAAQRAMSALFDRLAADPDAFRENDLRLAAALAKEFEMELDRTGEIRAEKTIREETVLPPRHWAYLELAAFAEAKLLKDPPPYRLLGGASFTRLDIARMVDALTSEAKKADPAWPEDKAASLKKLEAEFEGEIEWIRKNPLPADAVASAPAAGKRKPLEAFQGWKFGGSTVGRAGVEKGRKSDLSNRTTLKIAKGSMEYMLYGQLDNQGGDGADVDLGETYKFNINRHYLTVENQLFRNEEKVRTALGDVNNVDLANGLLVGSTNITGVWVSSPLPGDASLDLIYGDDGGDDPLAAARLEFKTGGKSEWGIVAANAAESGGAVRTMYGADVSVDSSLGLFKAECGAVEDGGHGCWMAASRPLASNVSLILESRRYRNYYVENNNAPLYGGLSGGGDENERGGSAAFEWSPGPNVTVTVERDVKYSFDDRDPTADLFFRARWKGPGDLSMEGSVEKENRKKGPGKRSTVLGASKKINDRVNFSASYTLDRDVDSVAKTWRSRVKWVLFPEKANATLSYSNQMSRSGRIVTPQIQLNAAMGGDAALSITASFPDKQNKKYTVSMTDKF